MQFWLGKIRISLLISGFLNYWYLSGKTAKIGLNMAQKLCFVLVARVAHRHFKDLTVSNLSGHRQVPWEFQQGRNLFFLDLSYLWGFWLTGSSPLTRRAPRWIISLSRWSDLVVISVQIAMEYNTPRNRNVNSILCLHWLQFQLHNSSVTSRQLKCVYMTTNQGGGWLCASMPHWTENWGSWHPVMGCVEESLLFLRHFEQFIYAKTL